MNGKIFYTTGMLIRSCRIELGLTQSELAQRAGVWETTFSKWENDVRVPSAVHLKKLEEIFGVHIRPGYQKPKPLHTQQEQLQAGTAANPLWVLKEEVALLNSRVQCLLILLGTMDEQTV